MFKKEEKILCVFLRSADAAAAADGQYVGVGWLITVGRIGARSVMCKQQQQRVCV